MNNIINAFNSKQSLICGEGLDDIQIEKAERELNLRFAEEYKKYLKEFGLASFDGYEFSGIGCVERLNVVSMTQEAKKNNRLVPDDFYVIEDVGIDYILLWQNNMGQIFETHYNSIPRKIYDSFADYINSITD